MAKSYQNLAVSKETHDLVINECVEEFYRQHPNMRGIPISQDYIILRMARYYLDMPQY